MKHRNRQLPPLTLGLVRKIKEVTGLDLLRAGEPEVAGQLWTDPVLAGLVIATAGGPEDLEGDELAKATEELADVLLEFFPPASIYDDFTPENETAKPGEVNPWRIVFKAAGCAGVDPWPYSLRELIWMAEGAFEPFAAILADYRNAHAAKNAKPVEIEILNPWNKKRPRPKRSRSENAGTSKS